MSEPERRPADNPDGSPLRVVIVDDNPDDRALVGRVLGREYPDVSIEEVIDQEGLDRTLAHGAFDLTITDFQLRWSDGLAVLRAVKACHPDRPVVMFTGTGSEEIAVEAMKNGLDDYVLKSPQHLGRLMASVHSVLSLARERSANREAEEMLYSLKKAVDTLPIGVTIADTQGKIVYTNPAEAVLHGYGLGELIGREARIFVPGEFWSSMSPYQITAINPWKRERVNVRKDGTRFPAQLLSVVVRTPTGKPIAVVTTCEDVTERRRTEDRLRRDALYDALTGLPNRALLMDRLGRALRRANRQPQARFAVLFLDLDRFKLVNDSFGHEVGDQLLVQVARRLEGSLRPSDTVCRFGGDEFVLLAEDIEDLGDVVQIAERAQKELSQSYRLGAQEVFISASIGIALGRSTYGDASEVLRDADTAMYRAKAQGKARYAVFQDEMYAGARELLSLDTELRRGLERGELVIHYQPIVSLLTGRAVTVEALVRWQHPKRGLLLPDQFIPFAEETGLILPLGEWVLRAACAQARAWQDAGLPGLRVAVNISSRQLRQENFTTIVRAALQATGLDPRSLDLELTESVLIDDPTESARRVAEVKALGVKIALDDFGTGYSSLNYLRRLPVDTLKIDRSFVQDIATGQRDAAIAAAVIAMARTLELGMVAEGVEAREQLTFLREVGCEQVQGNLLSVPLPAEDVERIVRNPFL
jgi:diguanylate cyclase (GGDEF)-like protein/PAS domain S-box-containing protein